MTMKNTINTKLILFYIGFLSKSTCVIFNSCFYLAILNIAHVCNTYAMSIVAIAVIVILPAYVVNIKCVEIMKKYVSSSTKYSTSITNCRDRDSFIGTITSST